MLLDHFDVAIPLVCRRFSWDSSRTRRDDDISVGVAPRHGLVVGGISIIGTVEASGLARCIAGWSDRVVTLPTGRLATTEVEPKPDWRLWGAQSELETLPHIG
jgi:hypothetical protein